MKLQRKRKPNSFDYLIMHTHNRVVLQRNSVALGQFAWPQEDVALVQLMTRKNLRSNFDSYILDKLCFKIFLKNYNK